jgi:hypothetical protein
VGVNLFLGKYQGIILWQCNRDHSGKKNTENPIQAIAAAVHGIVGTSDCDKGHRPAAAG